MTTLSKSAKDLADVDPSHNEKISKMFDKLNEHAKNGDFDNMSKVKGEIKDYALKAPKGSIDLGHFTDHREEHSTMDKHAPKSAGWRAGGEYTPEEEQQNESARKFYQGKFKHSDFVDIINHHVGDQLKSLKQVADKRGMGAVKGLMRAMGANCDGTEDTGGYSNLKLHPRLHYDIMDVMNPGKSDYYRKSPEGKAAGLLPVSAFHRTQADPDLHQKVVDTWNNMYVDDEDPNNEDEYPGSNPTKARVHEDAVMDRGLELFKRHYNIDDDK
jgi:hypothetical protein